MRSRRRVTDLRVHAARQLFDALHEARAGDAEGIRVEHAEGVARHGVHLLQARAVAKRGGRCGDNDLRVAGGNDLRTKLDVAVDVDGDVFQLQKVEHLLHEGACSGSPEPAHVLEHARARCHRRHARGDCRDPLLEPLRRHCRCRRVVRDPPPQPDGVRYPGKVVGQGLAVEHLESGAFQIGHEGVVEDGNEVGAATPPRLPNPC